MAGLSLQKAKNAASVARLEGARVEFSLQREASARLHMFVLPGLQRLWGRLSRLPLAQAGIEPRWSGSAAQQGACGACSKADLLPLNAPPMSFFRDRSVPLRCLALFACATFSAAVSQAGPVQLAKVRNDAGASLRALEQTPLEISGTVTAFDEKRHLVVLQDSSCALAVRGIAERFVLGEYILLTAEAYAVSSPRLESFPFHPDRSESLKTLRFDADQSRFYVDRIRGQITAPESGDYTFFLSSDDSGELWLSTDGEPAHARKIASVAEWTALDDFHRYPTQRSAPIHLAAGQICYVEVLHEQQQGKAGLSVVWSGPSFDKQPITDVQGVNLLLS